MPNIISESKYENSISDSIKALCKVGLYQDALTRAESEWGPINTWISREKRLIAMRLYMNLGGDRKSDALLLRLWRQDRNCPDLLIRVLFYKLNKLGPILANEFVKKHAQTILSVGKHKSDLLGFKSILQRIKTIEEFYCHRRFFRKVKVSLVG